LVGFWEKTVLSAKKNKEKYEEVIMVKEEDTTKWMD
jgi:hypothetical protein